MGSISHATLHLSLYDWLDLSWKHTASLKKQEYLVHNEYFIERSINVEAGRVVLQFSSEDLNKEHLTLCLFRDGNVCQRCERNNVY